ncbi:MAG: multidrug efflux MFS transporter [Clostridiales Family XIII bacterium]|jgi:EmrB/QacA subfamily drug resistance transporter|nr:multidrug efflux MFS transporter [Clostridiales Family XIII bacterium]
MTEHKKEKLSRQDRLMVAIIVAGGFATILNQTVMGTALPSVMDEFGINAAKGQWLTSVFLLVNGLMIPVTAFLINRYSTRQLFLSSMGAFIAGSVLAIVAWRFEVLLLARILQAMGAGVMLPFVSVMLMLIFPKERRGFAMGIAGIVIGAAPAIGPTLAGLLVDLHNWHYIFIAFTPVCVAVMVFAVIFLKNIGDRKETHLDLISVVLSTVGFGGLLYGFSAAGSAGWLHWQTWGSILAGGITIIFFVRRQYRVDKPLLDLRVFRYRDFTMSTVLVSIVGLGMTVGSVITPIYLQTALGYSAMKSGLLLMPAGLLMAAMSPVSGTFFDRFGPRALTITGLGIITVGTLMLGRLSLHSSEAYLIISYTFRMMGISFVNMPLNTWGINALPNRKIPDGNAITNTARQVTGSMGTAILVTVMVMVAGLLADRGSPEAMVQGVNAAFNGAAIATGAALALSILKVDRGKKKVKRKEDER